jgi:YfiH family protein
MKDFTLVPNWPAPANVKALTTIRPTDHKNLPELSLPSTPSWIHQVHGKKVICADDLTEQWPEADASVAFKTGTVSVVLTADCLPVLLCDQDGTQVAAIHAGWRSLAAGIIAETTKQLTAPLYSCLAWLGPAIGSQAFEVGQDVLDSFLAYGWDAQTVQTAFKPCEPPGKFLGDLNYLARATLQQQGILVQNIYGGEWCTHSDPDRFYSYRRSADTGRMASLIWRE